MFKYQRRGHKYNLIVFILILVTSFVFPITPSATVMGSTETEPLSTTLPTKPVASAESGEVLSTILPTLPTENELPETTPIPTPEANPIQAETTAPTNSDNDSIMDDTLSNDTESLADHNNVTTTLDPVNDSSTLSDPPYPGSESLAEFEQSSASDTIAESNLRVVIPTTIDFYIDTDNLAGRGTIFSPEYAIVNHSNVDIEFSITELFYSFNDISKFRSFSEPFDSSIAREENSVYMYLRHINSTVFNFTDEIGLESNTPAIMPPTNEVSSVSDNSMADTTSDNNMQPTDVPVAPGNARIASDNRVQPIYTGPDFTITDQPNTGSFTVILKAANYDEHGNFVSLNQDSIFLFDFTGEASMGTDSSWVSGEMKIHMVYSWDAFVSETENLNSDLLTDPPVDDTNPTQSPTESPTLQVTPSPSGLAEPDLSPLPSESPLASESPLPSGSPLPDESPLPSGSMLPTVTPSPLPGEGGSPSASPSPSTYPIETTTPVADSTPSHGPDSPVSIPSELPAPTPVIVPSIPPAPTPVNTPASIIVP